MPFFDRLRRKRHRTDPVHVPPVVHPFDRTHGTDTGGLIPPDQLQTPHPSSQHTTAYYAMSPSRFSAAIDLWRRSEPAYPIEQTTFLDLGCGKGRAVLLASELPFAQVVGVELHPRLARIAQANAMLWLRSRPKACPIHILHADAIDVGLPPGPTLLYLFHPFAEPVTLRLIRHMRAQQPASLDIIYFNPEAADLWLAQPEISFLWSEVLAMSPADAAADSHANPDDLCHAYRWRPIPGEPAEVLPIHTPPS